MTPFSARDLPLEPRVEVLDIMGALCASFAAQSKRPQVLSCIESAQECGFTTGEILLTAVVREAAWIRLIASASGQDVMSVIRKDLSKRHDRDDMAIFDEMLAEMLNTPTNEEETHDNDHHDRGDTPQPGPETTRPGS